VNRFLRESKNRPAFYGGPSDVDLFFLPQPNGVAPAHRTHTGHNFIVHSHASASSGHFLSAGAFPLRSRPPPEERLESILFRGDST